MKIRELIQKVSDANPLGGTPRTIGELAKLGIEVAKSTVDEHRLRPETLLLAVEQTDTYRNIRGQIFPRASST